PWRRWRPASEAEVPPCSWSAPLRPLRPWEVADGFDDEPCPDEPGAACDCAPEPLDPLDSGGRDCALPPCFDPLPDSPLRFGCPLPFCCGGCWCFFIHASTASRLARASGNSGCCR